MQPLPSEEPNDQQGASPEETTSVSGGQPPVSAPTGSIPPDEPSFFYMQEDAHETHEDDIHDEESDAFDGNGQSGPFVLPFQHSLPMPAVAPSTTHKTQGTRKTAAASWGKEPRKSGFSSLKILLIVTMVVLTIAVGGMVLLLAASAAPVKVPAVPAVPANSSSRQHSTPAHPSSQPTSPRSPTSTPTAQTGQGATTQPATTVPSAQLLSQIGWTAAGLSLGDAVEAQRTAMTFTDREMSYDYRDIGTLTQHGGSLTSARFLLTPGATVRFAHNDVRLINNTLYNRVAGAKIIQQVVDAQPFLTHYQTISGTGQFAWVTVSFTLVQSQVDPATGQRTEGMDVDPATGHARIHQMMVLLVRVPPEKQGVTAPMGGTGWLVNVYALDMPTLLDPVTSPSL